ncbi:YHS domain-containing (seleno)protein [Ekhidna sp.]|uniref:YHS domain-containing (seleno)protein n=1 Tax=Ekhidna sp. TaxID=2608089 RepID=UPI003BAAAD57
MKTFASTFLFLASIIAFAQKSPIYSTKDGAIKGYDPVAYFVKGEPVKGIAAYTLKWKEADWYFSSQENLETFKANPEKYAPQFGGFCAFGVSKGSLYKIEPDAWKIVGGKLYLNYSKGIQKKWEADQTNFIKQAEINWPKVIDN